MKRKVDNVKQGVKKQFKEQRLSRMELGSMKLTTQSNGRGSAEPEGPGRAQSEIMQLGSGRATSGFNPLNKRADPDAIEEEIAQKSGQKVNRDEEAENERRGNGVLQRGVRPARKTRMTMNTKRRAFKTNKEGFVQI